MKTPLKRPDRILRFQDTGIEDVQEVGRAVLTRAQSRMSDHVHDSHRFEVSFLARGQQRYLVNGVPHTLLRGDVLIVKPNDRHRGGWPEGKGVLYWLACRLPDQNDRFMNLRGRPAESMLASIRALAQRHFHSRMELQTHFDAILEDGLSIHTDPLACPRILNNITAFFLAILADAGRAENERKDSLEWGRRAVHFIEAHIRDPLRVQDMADHMKISRSRLQSRFIEATGFSPAEYVKRRRIELAKEYLVKTDQAVTDIALDLGFSSSQHFATLFLRYVMRRPSEYRAIARRTGTPPP